MKIQAKVTDLGKVAADLLVVFAATDKKGSKLELSEEAKIVDKQTGNILSKMITAEDFKGSKGQLLLTQTYSVLPSMAVLVVGLGNISEITVFDWQTAGALIARKGKAVGAKKLAIGTNSLIDPLGGVGRTVEGLVEGLLLGSYTFEKHKGKKEAAENKEKKDIDEVAVFVSAPRVAAAADAIARGELVSQGVTFTRDLINEPPSVTTPTHLADVAQKIAKSDKNVQVEVLGPREMEKLGMGGLLGIARGSAQEPRFIKLEYKGSSGKPVTLVGKGITFDSGGLSIKPAQAMETMKLDMSGAAAILGVFSVLSALKVKEHVVGLISATENMLGPWAIKPGDVVSIMNGKTVEILNTDAEGRVVLADALSYAVEKVKPKKVIDLATLTGACMVALGNDLAGLFVNDEEFGTTLKKVAAETGERVWELPLVREYKPLIKSHMADIKNIGGDRYGGAITGALFLQEFVPDDIPWAHLDIAGPSFAEKDTPLNPLGGTGWGVRLILKYLMED